MFMYIHIDRCIYLYTHTHTHTWGEAKAREAPTRETMVSLGRFSICHPTLPLTSHHLSMYLKGFLGCTPVLYTPERVCRMCTSIVHV